MAENPFDDDDESQDASPVLPPLAVYCRCGAYVLLLGETDFECDQCGGVFSVQGVNRCHLN